MLGVYVNAYVTSRREWLKRDVKKLRDRGVTNKELYIKLEKMGWTLDELSCLFTYTAQFLTFIELSHEDYTGGFWMS